MAQCNKSIPGDASFYGINKPSDPGVLFCYLGDGLTRTIHRYSADLLLRKIELAQIQFSEGRIFVSFEIEKTVGEIAEGDPLG